MLTLNNKKSCSLGNHLIFPKNARHNHNLRACFCKTIFRCIYFHNGSLSEENENWKLHFVWFSFYCWMRCTFFKVKFVPASCVKDNKNAPLCFYVQFCIPQNFRKLLFPMLKKNDKKPFWKTLWTKIHDNFRGTLSPEWFYFLQKVTTGRHSTVPHLLQLGAVRNVFHKEMCFFLLCKPSENSYQPLGS